MKKLPPVHFNLRNSPIEGPNLIEASAGTGKTYTISGIFLRLILEKGMAVNKILVVTFTEAATQELKDRIRRQLRAALEVLEGDVKNKDADFIHFVQSVQSVQSEAEKTGTDPGIRALRRALRDFDEAAIFTIHGFCKRMLHEHAFESGVLFDTELITSQTHLKAGIVEDFWRKHLYNEMPLFVDYVRGKMESPSDFLSILNEAPSLQHPRILPEEVDIPEMTAAIKDFEAAFEEAASEWKRSKSQVTAALGSSALNGNMYQKRSVLKWIEEIEALFAGDPPVPALNFFDKFHKFTTDGICAGTKKKQTPPAHPFFDVCQRLYDCRGVVAENFENRLMNMKVGLFDLTKEQLAAVKEIQNVQSFDDLLENLHRAIQGDEGPSLCRNIQEKFTAALIDEFQDTDPVQYEIFKTIFGEAKCPLFLIGDPKQAIYGFRGADVFAYMKAAAYTPSRFTLPENWRSQENLIQGVNTLFKEHARAFVYKEIAFEEVRAAAGKKDRVDLTIDRKSEPPLHLWLMEAEKISPGKKAIPKEDARRHIVKAVAAEISRLLSLEDRIILKSHSPSIPDRPLHPGDIAVLVRRNTEAEKVEKELSALGIPSVRYQTGDIFDAKEAGSLSQLLPAVASPSDEARIKGALSTEIMGLSGTEIDGLTRNESDWEAWIVRFREYHELWNRKGFMRMFNALLEKENVLPRLMALPAGERRCTNLLHLGELLHEHEIRSRPGMAGLLKWFAEQRSPEVERPDENPLRLESDARAVKLVTMHKSKGLEYPVVFCPFTWDGSAVGSKNSIPPILFHDEKNDRKLTLDIGSEDIAAHRPFAEKEQLAENLRLLYVALTRPKNRCYLVWGKISEAETSAPAYLLHWPGNGDENHPLERLSPHFIGLTDHDIRRDLERLKESAKGAIEMTPLPDEKGIPYKAREAFAGDLHPREFSGTISGGYAVTSFSALSRAVDRPHVAEMADYDGGTRKPSPDPDTETETETETETVDPRDIGLDAGTIFAFPSGALAGECLHKIFEDIDFTGDGESLGAIAEKHLFGYGFDPGWAPTVCDMVKKTLNAPLDPETGLRLSDIPMEQRLNEMGFYFPLNPAGPSDLAAVFREYGDPMIVGDLPDRIDRLRFVPEKGYMKGFIDLVFEHEGRFYLIDWKSNHLGHRVGDYDGDALKGAMQEHFYLLQYHIYVLALDNYLRSRIPDYSYEEHFGGIFYLFLRGIDPEKGGDIGIFADKPPAELMEALRKVLLDCSGMAGEEASQ